MDTSYKLKRLSRYLFEIAFDSLPPEPVSGIDAISFGCSSYVRNGMLYRNLDWNYDNLASFKVICPEFNGMSFVSGLTDSEQPVDKLMQLPYRIVDGVNKHGIMCSTHVLYNDWDGIWNGEIPLTSLPFLVLSNVRSMETLEADLAGILDNIYVPPAMAEMEYLIQVLVTDGTTAYVLAPSETSGVYEAINITENPKLANFRWASDATVTREQLQRRPTGVERWNMMPCPLKDLRFTKAYEQPTRLSEFIGLRDTTKYSTDEELLAIYEDAHELYRIRTRDGTLWQTMHSVVYAPDGMKRLWVQEDWKKDYESPESGIINTIKSGILSSGRTNVFRHLNHPARYADRRNQYFQGETADFVAQYARYASDFFDAEAQGLYEGKPLEWTKVRMRLADVVRPSSAIQREFDDYKMCLIESPRIDYIPQGTKFRAMGSIWLMVNPLNVSKSVGSGIVRRCKAVWNHLDYYGNVLSEPMVVDNARASASESDSQQFERDTKGYFNITCQKNAETSQLNTNSRIMLGSGVYRITGYTDFLQEFTGDYGSVRLLQFTARYEEPNEQIDDYERHIADGKTFSWKTEIGGNPNVSVGESRQLTVTSLRNGTEADSTEENPISYIWTSSNPEIASADAAGLVTGVSEGETVITATLAQNPAYSATRLVTVAGSAAEPRVSFLSTIPERMNAYQSFAIEAAYFENGEQTEETVEWSFSGAEKGSYSVEINGNKATICAWSGSIEPLVITANHREVEAETRINLFGF